MTEQVAAARRPLRTARTRDPTQRKIHIAGHKLQSPSKTRLCIVRKGIQDGWAEHPPRMDLTRGAYSALLPAPTKRWPPCLPKFLTKARLAPSQSRFSGA